MAHNSDHAKQPSSWLLWLIIPGVIATTLYFTLLYTAPVKPSLNGDLGNLLKTEAKATHKAEDGHEEKAPGMHVIELGEGKTIEVPQGSAEHEMAIFLADPNQAVDKMKWFNLDNVNFVAGSEIMDPSSAAQIDHIHTIMMAYPKSKIRIGAYSDNVNNKAINEALSLKRAQNIIAELVKLGIGEDRLEAAGYGEQLPVGDENTEEGRAQNRRMAALLVIEK